MRFIFSCLFILATLESMYACDLCGSAGSNVMGILPAFRQHFAGFRYQYRSFETKHPGLHGTSESLNGKDSYQSWEAFSRWTVHDRLQLFMTVPFHNYRRIEDNTTYHTSGVGDISLLLMGVIFDNTRDADDLVSHALQAGIGVKVPVGSYKLRQDGFLIHPNLQPGTGTWDIPVSAIYTLRYNKWGLNTEMQYLLNGSNDLNYHYGDNMLIAGRLFYWYNKSAFTLLPQAGIQWDHQNKDTKGQSADPYTGGNQFVFSAGCDVYFGNIALGFTWNKPFAQKFGDGFVSANPSLTARINYLF